MNNKLVLFDDIDWSYEYTLTNYLKLNKKQTDELTNSDYSEIYECAGIHIAFFYNLDCKKRPSE